jgi:hypothetical protein
VSAFAGRVSTMSAAMVGAVGSPSAASTLRWRATRSAPYRSTASLIRAMMRLRYEPYAPPQGRLLLVLQANAYVRAATDET